MVVKLKHWTMEMNGGSSAPYLACTPCVPLFCTLFNKSGSRKVFRPPRAGGDHFHCAVEPFQERKGHINLRKISGTPAGCPSVPGTPGGTNRGLPAGVPAISCYLLLNKQKVVET